MYISMCIHIILVIITIETCGDDKVKKVYFLFMTGIMCLSVTACVHSGEKDSTDFFNEMLRKGYVCNIAETESGNSLKESCYVDNFKLSIFSDGNGKLMSVSLTYGKNESFGFDELAREVVNAFCDFDSKQIDTVFQVLGIGINLPSDSHGVRRCDTQWYGFSFVCDEVGGTLAVENYRVSPTSAPEVTINTTVEFVSFPSSEKTLP